MCQYCLSPKSNEETDIQNSHALYGQKYGYFYAITTFVAKFAHTESGKNVTLSSEPKGPPPGLPYRVNYMVDVDTYFVPIFIHMTTFHMSLLTLLLALDAFYLMIIEHCCGQFEALRYRLENAVVHESTSNAVLVETYTKDKCYLNIVYSVRRHTEAMQFVAIMKSVYNVPLFAQLAFSLLTLSVIEYQIATTTDVGLIIHYISHLNGLLFTVFFENWQGQKIINSSEKVFESAYNTKWYDMSIATKKLLVMIMMESKKSLTLTAGELIVLSYITFNAESHYNSVRISLSGIGLWPFHTAGRRYTIYLVIILILGSGVMVEILGIAQVWHDIFEVIDSMPLFFLGVFITCRSTCAVCKLPKIKTLLIKMHQYYLSPKSNEETKIQNSHALYGRNFGYVYAIFIMSCGVIFIVTTFVAKFIHTQSDKNDTLSSKSKGPPPGIIYRVNYMVDVDTYFVPIFIHITTFHMCLLIVSVTLDVFYVTLIEHCCGQFEALRYRLENAFEHECNNNVLLVRTSTKDKCYLNIVYSIRRHTETMQFVAIMNSVFNVPLFVHLASSLLILSVLEYQIATTTDVGLIVHHVSYFNGLLFNVFFENWQGQKIINSSEKVFESAYNTKWYNMSIATKKLLLMIMMESKQSLSLTAGKLVVLSYITFNAVVRSSASYFMLLRSL
ncbi:uncharacterized protein LOC109855631 [Pseudomyrmex gracilis]|uniref:uncharacterized protein LOC109855631 n=1 Tax=Pseudomyrmex gracilis TaxID=219809 RepID=UPI00099586B6|nr:uncharacterized protein LOC109855631 [Pseudomyrmex gracilis]